MLCPCLLRTACINVSVPDKVTSSRAKYSASVRIIIPSSIGSSITITAYSRINSRSILVSDSVVFSIFVVDELFETP